MNDTGATVLYRGLEWTEVRNKALRAVSDTTGGTYVSESDSTGKQWTARFGFPDRMGRPFLRIGTFADPDTARIAAERHDYLFWSNSITRSGSKAIFVGSGTGESALGALSNKDASDIGEMLAEAVDSTDGAMFTHAASFFSAQKAGMKQERNGSLTLTMTINPGAIPRWLMEAAPGTDVLVGVLEVAGAQDSDWQERGQRALKRSFVLPSDNTFQNWLLHRYDRWRLVATAVEGGTSEQVEEAAAETLRRLISCPTRKTLSRDRDAIERIEIIDREFYADMTRGFGSITSG